MLLNAILFAAMVVCLILFQQLQKTGAELDRLITDQSVLDNIIKKELMFLHSEPQNFAFHETNSDHRLLEIADGYDSLFKRIAENERIYRRLLEDYYFELKEKQFITRHKQLFDKLLVKVKARGSRDYGTIGEMRNAIHVLEMDAQFLEMDEILSLRRSEKDFILRHEAIYAEQLNQKIQTLFNKYEKENGFNETDLQWLLAYKNKFNRVVDLINEIGDFGHSGLKRELEISVMDTNQMVFQIRSKYELYRANISRRILTGFLVTIFLGLTAGTVFSVYVSDYRTKPLKYITRKFQQNIDDRLRLQKIDLSSIPNIADEHAQLVVSFNKLIDHLNIQIDKVNSSNSDLKEKNSELVKVNKELDQFVYSVSHDIRAPITSIQGLINVLKMEGNRDSQGHYLAMIEDRLEKLDGFIKDMLDLSRNSRLKIFVEAIDLKILFDEVIEEHQYFGNSTIIGKEINIRQEVEFFSDRKRLKIVFSNLLSNAIRFSDMRKEDRKIVINVFSDRNTTSIEFWDNGIGIRKNYLENIFEMFFQANDHSDGSGLGLYIVMESIKKLNGELFVNSEYGHWTSFKIVLPNLIMKSKINKIAVES